MIPPLIRMACVLVTTAGTQRVLGQGECSAKTLTALQDLLEDETAQPLFYIAMRGERAQMMEMLEEIWRRGGSLDDLGSGSISTSRSIIEPIRIRNAQEEWLRWTTRMIEITKQPLAQQGTQFSKLGKQIDAQVLKVDAEKRRVSVGMKQLQGHPWDSVPDKYKVGERVRGTVTRVTDFGAFVELAPGVEGLIHVSEMSWVRKVRKPSDLVKPGETVEAVVLGVSAAEKRMSLGLKQALGDPWADISQKFSVGSVVEGPVVSVTKFGAFVQVAEGITLTGVRIFFATIVTVHALCTVFLLLPERRLLGGTIPREGRQPVESRVWARRRQLPREPLLGAKKPT